MFPALALTLLLASPLAADRGAPSPPVPDPAPQAAPDQAGLGGWRGVSLPGATCGRGAPYKYYLNPGPRADGGLVFVLNGGGACLKDGPAPPGASGVAEQLHCMAFSNFTDSLFSDVLVLSGVAPGLVPYLRREAANPLREATYVLLPYCTGDIHVGRMTAPYDYDPHPDTTFHVTHRGALNVLAALDDVQRQFPADQPVVLTGFSAGAFGAIFHFPAVISRWPRTTLLPDAGIAPSVPGSLFRREGAAIAARWDARAALPPYCGGDDCLQDTLHLLAAHAAQHDGEKAPWRPFGYLQGQRDSTLRDYLEVTTCGYQLGLWSGYHAGRRQGNLRAYLPATDKHVFGASAGWVSPGGKVDWFDWFAQVATAATESQLPADAVDPWAACNPAWLPMAWTGGR